MRTRSAISALFAIAFVALLAPTQPAIAQDDDHIWLPVITSTTIPRAPWPSNGIDSVSPNTMLTWYFEADEPESVRYSIFLDDTPPNADTQIVENLVEAYFEPATLRSGRRYYWRVVATLANGAMVTGPVWTFRTVAPEDPPEIGSMVSIPAGELQMGCDPTLDGGYGCRPREVPLHKVWIDTFEIDKYEVTNGQYRNCVDDGDCDAPRFNFSLTRPWYYGNPDYAQYPVLYVSWWNAHDYCEWADKRLPSEAEWEMAARGARDTRPWPWGEETIDCTRANFTDTRNHPDWDVCVGDTARVGSFPGGATPLGVMDLAGNAFEWVNDPWDVNYYKYSPYLNPPGPQVSTSPASEPSFVIRGGSYRPDWYYPRTFNRHWGHHGFEGVGGDSPYYRNDQVGFRCAR